MFPHSVKTGAQAALAALIAINTWSVSALAQQPVQKPFKPKNQADAEMQSFYHKLDKPVNLPEVPEIGSHAKFRFGLEHTDQSGLTSIGLRYGTTSTPQQVIDFYKQSLIASKWKLASVSTTTVRASKADKSLNICIMPRGGPDVITDFMVNYSYKSR